MSTKEVRDDDGNTVTIRTKLKLGQVRRFQAAVEAIDTSKPSGNIESVIAMLQHYVTAWSGPAFAELGPFDPAKVEEIDADAPIIEKTAEAIVAIYERKDAPDPKDSTSNGDSTSTASASPAPSANTALSTV